VAGVQHSCRCRDEAERARERTASSSSERRPPPRTRLSECASSRRLVRAYDALCVAYETAIYPCKLAKGLPQRATRRCRRLRLLASRSTLCSCPPHRRSSSARTAARRTSRSDQLQPPPAMAATALVAAHAVAYLDAKYRLADDLRLARGIVKARIGLKVNDRKDRNSIYYVFEEAALNRTDADCYVCEGTTLSWTQTQLGASQPSSAVLSVLPSESPGERASVALTQPLPLLPLPHLPPDAAVNRLAHWLLAQGLQRGDTIALYLPNKPAYPIIWLACLAIDVCVRSPPLALPPSHRPGARADERAHPQRPGLHQLQPDGPGPRALHLGRRAQARPVRVGPRARHRRRLALARPLDQARALGRRLQQVGRWRRREGRRRGRAGARRGGARPDEHRAHPGRAPQGHQVEQPVLPHLHVWVRRALLSVPVEGSRAAASRLDPLRLQNRGSS